MVSHLAFKGMRSHLLLQEAEERVSIAGQLVLDVEVEEALLRSTMATQLLGEHLLLACTHRHQHRLVLLLLSLLLLLEVTVLVLLRLRLL